MSEATTKSYRAMNGDEIIGMDPDHGVPVPMGARVWAGEIEGHVVGGTERVCVFRDDKGEEHAERWPLIQVQASGPAEGSVATDGKATEDETFVALTAAERSAMELNGLVDLAAMLAMKLETEKDFEDLEGLRDKVHDIQQTLTFLAGRRREALIHVEVFAEAGHHCCNAD